MIRILVGLFMILDLSNAWGAPQFDCRKLWDMEKELGCFAYYPTPVNTQNERKEFVMESQFGPSSCKASNTVEGAKKELKTECDGWIKERKGDLGTKFRTGTCNVKCDSCGQGLERCMMTGLVHYTDQDSK
jgi:hypothetical protein